MSRLKEANKAHDVLKPSFKSGNDFVLYWLNCWKEVLWKHHMEDKLQHSLNVKQVAAGCVHFCNPINFFVKSVWELKLSLGDINHMLLLNTCINPLSTSSWL